MPRNQQLLYIAAQVTCDILILIHTGLRVFTDMLQICIALILHTVIAVAHSSLLLLLEPYRHNYHSFLS